MYRASVARSLAAIFTALSLFAVSFAPVVANAQTNICPEANTACATQASVSGKAGCYCNIPPGYVVTGFCSKQEQCTGTAWGVGTAKSLADAQSLSSNLMSTLPPSADSALNPSLLSQAGSWLSKNPLLGGLAIGAGMSLLTSLLTSSGSSNSTSGTTPTTGVCTTQFYYTTDPNAPLSDPCAIYEPSASTSTTPTGISAPDCTINDLIGKECDTGYTAQSEGIGANGCTIWQCVANSTSGSQCPLVVSVDCPTGYVSTPQSGTDANGCALPNTCVSSTTQTPSCPVQISVDCPTGYISTPQSGTDSNGCALPNTCVLSTTPLSQCPTVVTPACSAGEVLQNNGTDSNGCPLAETCVISGTTSASSSTSGQCPAEIALDCGNGYVSQNTGTDSNGCAIQSCVAVSSTCPAITEPVCDSSQVLQDNGIDQNGCELAETCVDSGDTGTALPISEVLNSTVYYADTTSASTPAASSTPLNNPPVPIPQGLNGNIATLGNGATIYATSNSGNTEVAGFYGSNSTIGQLCESRPWASNFLSYIIPPAFFDNLCSWGGYPVGTIQTANTISTGAPQQNVSVGAPATSPSTYNSGTQAKAQIWAQPASVSLGGRTTIFWTSQGVTSCTESSSDGNFTGSSTSGGASTVALSGSVTFTIQCDVLGGGTTSDSTTVNIGI